MAAGDELRLGGHTLSYVNRFCYLGITLPANGKSFTAHIADRCRKAIIAANAIAKPQLLSLNTALRLFDLKVAPTASYGIEVIWERLSIANLETLNRVKSCFLKRTLCLHPTARSRYAFLLANAPLFIEDLVKRYNLPTTKALTEWIRIWEVKLSEIDPSFFNTKAMQSEEWKGPGRVTRHLTTRFALHGFHNKLCLTEGFHEPTETCVCRLCRGECPRYHAASCRFVVSMRRLDASTG